MDIGIFAKTFVRHSLREVLDAIHQHGLTKVQFNMSCAGLASLPDCIDPLIAQEIYEQTSIRNIQIVAVSGTFNMVHRNAEERKLGLKRLRALAAACRDMGTMVITLCTGSRDPNNMWRKHPANSAPSAWKDLLETMEVALQIAEENQVVLAFEPEPANVVDTPEKGRRLLDEMKSAYLKVVMDAANLFQRGNIQQMEENLDKAFYLLGNDIVVAHAKDIKIINEELKVMAAGEGVLNYDVYIKLLNDYNFKGALILHSLDEDQVDTSVCFIRQKIENLLNRV